MKKKFLFLLLICSIFFGGFVKAAEATYKDYGIIKLLGDQSKTIYKNTSTNVDTVEGVTYDEETNTLTLTNYKGNVTLRFNDMSPNFKIKLVGENELTRIMGLLGPVKNPQLTITGDGTLKVNPNSDDVETPIALQDITLTIDENVKLEVYSASDEYLENLSVDKKYLIYILSPDEVDPAKRIIIKGKSSLEPKRDILLNERPNISVLGYTEAYEFGDSITCKIVYDSDGITHVAYQYYDSSLNEKWKVIGEEVIVAEDGELYFINKDATPITSMNDLNLTGQSYDSFEALLNDFEGDPNQGWNEISYAIDFIHLRLRYDSDGEKYAINPSDGSVYKILDETIKGNYGTIDGTYEKVEKITVNPPSIDSLVIPTETFYVYNVLGDSLTIAPEKKTTNPKTQDNIIQYIIILSISLSSLYLFRNKKLA